MSLGPRAAQGPPCSMPPACKMSTSVRCVPASALEKDPATPLPPQAGRRQLGVAGARDCPTWTPRTGEAGRLACKGGTGRSSADAVCAFLPVRADAVCAFLPVRAAAVDRKGRPPPQAVILHHLRATAWPPSKQMRRPLCPLICRIRSLAKTGRRRPRSQDASEGPALPSWGASARIRRAWHVDTGASGGGAGAPAARWRRRGACQAPRRGTRAGGSARRRRL